MIIFRILIHMPSLYQINKPLSLLINKKQIQMNFEKLSGAAPLARLVETGSGLTFGGWLVES